MEINERLTKYAIIVKYIQLKLNTNEAVEYNSLTTII